MVRFAALVTALFMALLLGGCTVFPQEQQEEEIIPNPVATITMEDGSRMVIELYPYVAPNTVANFVNLAEQHFYDGLIFHRVIPGFMIQGGDPNGNGTGGPNYTIKGEFRANGIENDLSHTRGVVSMARASDYDSAGSQFFIMHADAKYLDGEYAAFGKLMDDESKVTLDIIANTPTDASDKPLVERRIKTITVDTKGYTYTTVKIEE